MSKVIASPLDSEHETVEPAADAEQADTVSAPQESGLGRERCGDRHRDRADVAERLVGGIVALLRYLKRAEHSISVTGSDLVADHAVDVGGPPSADRVEAVPRLPGQGDAVLEDLRRVCVHDVARLTE